MSYLCKAMYNLSLPRLSANYYGLPTTVQLRAAHESRCSLFGVLQSTAQVLYCTCVERHTFGTVHEYPSLGLVVHLYTGIVPSQYVGRHYVYIIPVVRILSVDTVLMLRTPPWVW